MESNTFKTAEPAEREGLGLATAVVGIFVLVAAFAVDPFGRPVVLLSWVFFLCGLALATLPGRSRAFGLGLAFAGGAPPLALFSICWVVLSVGVLGGSLS